MHIQAIRIRNFRRLKDVLIELSDDISIFVGANNSGKTSASQALQLFLAGARDRISLYDFSGDCWRTMNDAGEAGDVSNLPNIAIDIWFHVEEVDLHRVIDLLPGLNWEGTSVGLRIQFAASDPQDTLERFQAAKKKASAGSRPASATSGEFHPRPRNLCEYLVDQLRKEFEFHYYVLDHKQFDSAFRETDEYMPFRLTPENGRTGKDILNSIVRVDFLSAQRHLSDVPGGSRAEDLSRCLSRFYDRNLEKRGDDFDAIRALADSETMLNDHLSKVFEPTLSRLADLGYPGVANPRLVIRSALNPAALMSSYEGARVYYALDGSDDGPNYLPLPDRYNGLGFKNLIYIVVELLDVHTQWLDTEIDRPPLHLIFIEEPEAHLHAQLQQVFIRKVLDILKLDGETASTHRSQLVVTTHSPHILYERGFRPIRYFRRCSSGGRQYSEVLNLSQFYSSTSPESRDFLERYLKLTHCDLFFADAAVLVEGNVERLLLPQMVAIVAPRLKSVYLCILEIGGAFGHRFKSLIDFLGITTLVVTDLDSVLGEDAAVVPRKAARKKAAGGVAATAVASAGSTCMANVAGAVTCNQTLIQWLPKFSAVSDLLVASESSRTQLRIENECSLVRVAYQGQVALSWGSESIDIAGRTIEEAFAFANPDWTQRVENEDLGLKIKNSEKLPVAEFVQMLHERIKSSSFKKTDFALAVLSKNPADWAVPAYISEGLLWLEAEAAPVQAASSIMTPHDTEPAHD